MEYFYPCDLISILITDGQKRTATVGNVPFIIKDFVLNILVMLRILDWVDYPRIAQWFYCIVFLFNINRFSHNWSSEMVIIIYEFEYEGYGFHFPIYTPPAILLILLRSIFYFIMEVYKIWRKVIIIFSFLLFFFSSSVVRRPFFRHKNPSITWACGSYREMGERRNRYKTTRERESCCCKGCKTSKKKMKPDRFWRGSQ